MSDSTLVSLRRRPQAVGAVRVQAEDHVEIQVQRAQAAREEGQRYGAGGDSGGLIRRFGTRSYGYRPTRSIRDARY
eukprot:3125119-Rhodomonas_salina.1